MKARGASIIEILIYTAILVLLMSVVVSTLLAISRSYRTLSAAQQVESAAESSLDRMLREVRGARSIDVSQSTFGASPGQLMLNKTNTDGSTTTVQFFLSSQSLHIKKAGVDMGPLNATSSKIANLIFRQITTTHSQAVKIELTIESGQGPSYRSKLFYGTAVLRGSYAGQ